MTESSDNSRLVVDERGMAEILEGLAGEILARHGGGEKLGLIGIQRRGVFISQRLGAILQKRLGRDIPHGILDINLYRDDWTTLGPRAVVGRSILNFDVTGMELVLADDVLYTGRTIRAAMEALADFGRPRKMELLALVDRGGRELPIQADYVGLKLETAPDERVDVLMSELDGADKVLLRKKQA